MNVTAFSGTQTDKPRSDNENGTFLEDNGPFGVPDMSHLTYVIAVSYVVTCCIGLFGNSTVILVILRHVKMKTVANYFIMNLAIADDLFLLSLPFFAHSSFTSDWIFGSGMCTFLLAMNAVNRFATIFTMVCMSIDRYLAIVYPVRSLRYRTVPRAQMTCTVVWVVSFVIITPYWMYGESQAKDPNRNVYRCGLMWPEEQLLENFRFWTIFQFTIGFLIPLLVVIGCYLTMVKKLALTVSPAPLRSYNPRNPTSSIARPTKKVTVMILIVIVVFTICWTPFHIIEFISLRNHERFEAAYARGQRYIASSKDIVTFTKFNTAAQIMVFIGSCCNPFIYGLRSRDFRKYKLL